MSDAVEIALLKERLRDAQARAEHYEKAYRELVDRLLNGVFQPPKGLFSGASKTEVVLNDITPRRAAFLSGLADGATIKQLSEALEISEGSIRVAMHRTRKILGADATFGAIEAGELLEAVTDEEFKERFKFDRHWFINGGKDLARAAWERGI